MCHVCGTKNNHHSSISNMLVEIYYDLDEFDKHIYQRLVRLNPGNTPLKRKPKGLTVVEISTILIYYHLSYYKNFKRYYEQNVLRDMKRDFKKLPTYKNFINQIPGTIHFLQVYLAYRCKRAERTGKYFIDSTAIKACHPKRAHQNKVMKEIASWGKTSVGWFFGIKIHLIINELGQLMNVTFTTGSVQDNNQGVLETLTSGLKGWLFGDKGYILNAKKKAVLERDGELKIITKARKNMKADPTITNIQKAWLSKRGVIECVIAGTKEECNIEHTRHRSAKNAVIQMLSGLLAYTFRERFPSVSINLKPLGDGEYLPIRA
jgi:hypothetical protein